MSFAKVIIILIRTVLLVSASFFFSQSVLDGTGFFIYFSEITRTRTMSVLVVSSYKGV